jgi:Protein of unknown function (DUF2721)
MPDAINAVPLDNIAHVIQVALTPVFLLSGIGALLNVFNTRLARVSDHVSHTTDLLVADPQGEDAALMRSHIRRLRRRVLALDAAILLAALGGATTCGAAFTLFVGATRNANTAFVLLLLFGSALGCTVAALGSSLSMDCLLGTAYAKRALCLQCRGHEPVGGHEPPTTACAHRKCGSGMPTHGNSSCLLKIR